MKVVGGIMRKQDRVESKVEVNRAEIQTTNGVTGDGRLTRGIMHINRLGNGLVDHSCYCLMYYGAWALFSH